ncbi:hypothetical protein H0X10_01205 [Candidatus Saccharibacteria bacterium]|nr:hypothetical protein [Candidatus Saccharibacteria bacterium]
MSAPKYNYGHKQAKRRPRKALVVLFSSLTLIGLIGGIMYFDLRKNVGSGVEGESRVVSQVLSDNAGQITIDEPNYSLELPSDWKETGRNTNNLYTSITWQATTKGKDNRWLTLYMDRIPLDTPVNRIVTLTVQDNTLKFNDVSDNCASFTVGGTFNTGQASTLKPALTKVNKVDFICNLPRVNDNEVGTGTEGSVNSVTVTGPSKGTHKYFFLYTDRNFQPDYGLFYDVLRSFKAK